MKTIAGYASGLAHLLDELRCVDLLVRAAARSWRERLRGDQPEAAWGMPVVDDAEVDRYLEAPFGVPAPVPPRVEAEWAVQRQQARELDRAIADRVRDSRAAERLPLVELATALELTTPEKQALLLCVLGAVDDRYRRLFAYMQDDASRQLPSVGLLLQLLDPQLALSPVGADLFAADGRLRGHRLVHLIPRGESSSRTHGVQIDDHVLAWLLGGDAMPVELVDRVERLPAGGEVEEVLLPPATATQLRDAVERWVEAAAQGSVSPALWFQGPVGSQRRRAAAAAATAVSGWQLVVDHGDVPTDRAQRLSFVRVLLREALVRRAAVVWQLDGCREDEEKAELLTHLQEHGGPVVLIADCDPPRPRPGVPAPRVVRFETADVALRSRVWRDALARAPGLASAAAVLPVLAESFRLSIGEIERIVDDTALGTGVDSAAEQLLRACRRRSSANLGGMAQRIEPTEHVSFDDLVLPPASRKQVDDLRRRIANRRRVAELFADRVQVVGAPGLSALFSGPSGTGKSLAARLLASERHVALYRVDLAAVVSKYVGETEKNLGRLFDEAQQANAILFFDEADALFGKRGEVREARDRWANLEVNYLLQRIETFDGVVFLASNLRQNIDDAFQRRLQTVVEFPMPDARAREQIWRRLLPTDLPRPADADIARVARRFELAGGSIRNVVVDATFRAVAEAGCAVPAVELRHLAAALGCELQKLGRPVTRTDFGDELYPFAAVEVLGQPQER